MDILSEQKEVLWYLYIIETASGALYTGITTCLQKRFCEHSSKKSGAKFFHTSAPKKIVYTETLSSRKEASKREYAIKQLSRKQKLALIYEPKI